MLEYIVAEVCDTVHHVQLKLWVSALTFMILFYRVIHSLLHMLVHHHNRYRMVVCTISFARGSCNPPLSITVSVVSGIVSICDPITELTFWVWMLPVIT